MQFMCGVESFLQFSVGSSAPDDAAKIGPRRSILTYLPLTSDFTKV